MEDIWAIILAAGESKRMGYPKMLLDFNGSSMLEKVISNIKGSDVNDIIVVLGHDREKLTELARNASVKYCNNDDYKSGMLSSVITGVRNIPSDVAAIMIFQGDQPQILSVSVNKIISTYKSTRKGIIIPVFEKKRGHPLLIDRKYRFEIEKLDPQNGLRSLASVFPEDVLEVEVEDPGILKDFDTYDEYKSGINQE